VEVRADAILHNRARAVYVASDPHPDRHLILYDPSIEQFRNHLVAHECGHIRRLAAARPNERTVPIMTPVRRAAAMKSLLPELHGLARRGVPPEALKDLSKIWISGTVSQLADTPSDIRIERAIWEELPEVRGEQEASLEDQLQTAALGLRSVARAFTPDKVWRSSMAMNYALTKSCSEFMNRPDLLRPYIGTKTARLGEELLDILSRRNPAGLAEERRVSEEWAVRLGVREWFEWQRLDQLPTGFQRMWE
jgi:hypothetical protein